jgi:hypothetical protein
MLKHLLNVVIGHVSGLSDAQQEQIEQALPATKALLGDGRTRLQCHDRRINDECSPT